MEKKKPKWGTPNLIVIVKGDTQEGVLDYCKTFPSQSTPGGFQADCVGLSGCADCNIVTAS
jgi:hypothetical protein